MGEQLIRLIWPVLETVSFSVEHLDLSQDRYNFLSMNLLCLSTSIIFCRLILSANSMLRRLENGIQFFINKKQNRIFFQDTSGFCNRLCQMSQNYRIDGKILTTILLKIPNNLLTSLENVSCNRQFVFVVYESPLSFYKKKIQAASLSFIILIVVQMCQSYFLFHRILYQYTSFNM